MKTILFSAMAFAILASCTQVNSNGEKTVTQGGDTVSDVNISLSKMDAVEELANMKEEGKAELIFKAGGSEPGWTAEFYADRLYLVADYGKDKLTIKRVNIDLNQKVDLKIDLQSGAGDYILIQNKPCQNMAGETEERTVQLNYKGKLYTGCGSFKK